MKPTMPVNGTPAKMPIIIMMGGEIAPVFDKEEILRLLMESTEIRIFCLFAHY